MTTTAYTAENWPIAAAMLPFGSIDSHGGPIHDAEQDRQIIDAREALVLAS